MDPSHLFISFLVLFFMSNLTVLHADNPPRPPYLFREYIGAEWKNITFSDVPINPRVDFHFILSFGIDYAIPTINTNTTNTTNTTTASNSSSLPYPTNGNFSIYWDNVNLSPWHVSDIKAKHPNVKVALALGGDSIRGLFVNFSPTTIDSWVSNAISSITDIINEYHLDGIDIDYEHFNTDPDTFAECIGRLLGNLKENNLISFASIAPYANETVQQHYSALWAKFGYLIDYVNFQFYAYENTTTVDQLLGYYEEQRWNYTGGKIIASFGTDGSGGLSPKRGFFKACKILHTMKKLYGIFIWSADNSKAANYRYEKKAQHFLAYAS